MIPASLGPAELERLAGLFERGRLPGAGGAVLAAELRGAVTAAAVQDAAAALTKLGEAGFAAAQAALLLREVAAERRALQAARDQVELVWSGPEAPAAQSRDTGAVVRALFRGARKSVLLASYAFDQEARSRELFAALAENLDQRPALHVRFIVNIPRPGRDRPGADLPAEVLVEGFAARFFRGLWPGHRRPEVYHDPRALAPLAEGARASMHAKCLVVDEAQVLLTSANFTEAAQERNIEAGVLVQSAFLAQSLTQQFDTLCRSGALRRVPEPR